MDDFFEQVRRYIRVHALLPEGSRVVAGISGGADSLALLLLLERQRKPLGLQLIAAHVNHGLRGLSADEDEAFVRSWCEKLAVPCFCRRVDLVALAAGWGIGLEEAGRRVRYGFFDEIAPQALIALAHHSDDQAETLLLHLGRGCGLDGLVGMKPRSGRVVRPLLGQTRQAIEAWLTGQSVAWRRDESNSELFALRNRLRLQVLPVWQTALGYDPARMLCRTAGLLAEDQQLLDDLTREAIGRVRREDGL
ncbi:MAG TPA: tRNA lysidine(34) synthetase TilS, partial [Clostridiales bacterium]|nr:tRNA lysidine(34) synthetase TilS [Clostridiales bacterium]